MHIEKSDDQDNCTSKIVQYPIIGFLFQWKQFDSRLCLSRKYTE